MQPIGALLGGTLGALLGLRATLVISSLIMLIGTAVALFSPLRTLRRLPEPDHADQADQADADG
jgi:predicted MFS family arabinose efflux permease